MVVITHTNIVVDDFKFRKSNHLSCNHVYFLTHWHADHYWGLSNKWQSGPIYCSIVTKRLLLTKYPKLSDIVFGLELNMQHIIKLNPDGTRITKVRLMDSNHMAGSVMILFQGYFGRILHTGDMRFNLTGMVKANPYLFPIANTDYKRCSIPIDEVILDNTYCDPIFKFPPRSRAVELLCQIIDKHQGKRIFMATDSIGKEEVFVLLAKKYKIPIVVNYQRMRYVSCMNLNHSLFTRNPKDSWLEVVKKRHIQSKLRETPNSIAVTLTGWANIDSYYSYDNRNFIVPYSLHSNYSQLQDFMRAIHPGCLKQVVKHKKGGKTVRNVKRFEGYVNTVCHLNQRGFDFFIKSYIDPEIQSKQYRQLRDNPLLLDFVKRQLRIHQQSKPEGWFNGCDQTKQDSLDQSMDCQTSSSDDGQDIQDILETIEQQAEN